MESALQQGGTGLILTCLRNKTIPKTLKCGYICGCSALQQSNATFDDQIHWCIIDDASNAAISGTDEAVLELEAQLAAAQKAVEQLSGSVQYAKLGAADAGGLPPGSKLESPNRAVFEVGATTEMARVGSRVAATVEEEQAR